MKRDVFIFLMASTLMSVCVLADNARFRIYVVDERTNEPLCGMRIKGVFIERHSNWTRPVVDNDFVGETGREGVFEAKGKTNCGEAVFLLGGNSGFYDTPRIRVPFDSRDGRPPTLSRWWKPDNPVIAIALQRVERPIPLLVKRVEWRNWESGLRGLQGTNAVMRFDMLMGDWLPPYGHGERPDLEIASEIRITGKERRYRHSTRSMGDVVFYDLVQTVCPADAADCLSESHPSPSSGIMIRTGDDSGVGGRAVRLIGKRKRIERTGNWECEYTKDYDPDRCYTFRIRTRRDGDGNLVEAYYGKVYGDFMFSGDLERGVTEIRFLYYLNPTPLDRNLEWDMRNNLCPDPGRLGERRP